MTCSIPSLVFWRVPSRESATEVPVLLTVFTAELPALLIVFTAELPALPTVFTPELPALLTVFTAEPTMPPKSDFFWKCRPVISCSTVFKVVEADKAVATAVGAVETTGFCGAGVGWAAAGVADFVAGVADVVAGATDVVAGVRDVPAGQPSLGSGCCARLLTTRISWIQTLRDHFGASYVLTEPLEGSQAVFLTLPLDH